MNSHLLRLLGLIQNWVAAVTAVARWSSMSDHLLETELPRYARVLQPAVSMLRPWLLHRRRPRCNDVRGRVLLRCGRCRRSRSPHSLVRAASKRRQSPLKFRRTLTIVVDEEVRCCRLGGRGRRQRPSRRRLVRLRRRRSLMTSVNSGCRQQVLFSLFTWTRRTIDQVLQVYTWTLSRVLTCWLAVLRHFHWWRLYALSILRLPCVDREKWREGVDTATFLYGVCRWWGRSRRNRRSSPATVYSPPHWCSL